MATILAAQSARRGRARSRAATYLGWLKLCWIAWATHIDNRRAIAQLSSMSDDELKDIGIARSEIVGRVTGNAPCEARRTSFPDTRAGRRRRRDRAHSED